MSVIKCEKGHFYDNEKFTQCPHCSCGAASEPATEAFTSRQVEDYVAQYIQSRGSHQHVTLDEERTIGIYSGRGDTRYVAGWLVCVEGPAKGCDYRLYAGFNRIGRGYANDIVLKEDTQVSREAHCSVVYEEKKNLFYAVPQGGNLAYLDGEVLRQAEPMGEGSVLKVGESSLEFAAFCKGDKKWQ